MSNINTNINYLRNVLNDSLYYGYTKDVALTIDMDKLTKIHPTLLDDIAHLYEIDEKKYNNISNYVFIGKKWKCNINEVEKKMQEVIKIKPMLINIECFLTRKVSNNIEYVSDLLSYTMQAKKIIVIIDLFVEFLRINLI